jgi:hypothetical protein
MANAQQLQDADTIIKPIIIGTYSADTNINRTLPIGNGLDVKLTLPYSGVQVQPIALKNLETQNSSYVSAYAGTYNLFGTAAYLKLGNKLSKYNVLLNAERASGNIANQKFTNIAAAIQHIFETKRFNIDAQINGLADQRYLYGGIYNHTSINAANLLQDVKNIQANIDIKNRLPNNLFRNNIFSIATFYFVQNNNSEQNVSFKAPLNLLLHANQQIEIFAYAQLNRQSVLNNTYSNNYIQIGAAYHQESNNHRQIIHVGVQPLFVNNNLSLLPDVLISKYLGAGNFKIFASSIGTFESNNLKSLIASNGYYRPNSSVNASTVIKNSIGCATTLSRHLTFQTALGFSIYNNQISYANAENINSRNLPYFYINNANTNRLALEWGTSLDYFLNDHVQLGAIYNTRQFLQKSDSIIISNVPNTSMHAYMAVKLKSKLSLNIELDVLNGSLAEKNVSGAKYLPTYIDLGGKFTYKLSKRFDAFANCYNLLNNKKYRFENYANFGLGFGAGLKCAL